MFEGLADKIQGKPVPVAKPKSGVPTTKAKGAMFSGLAESIRSTEPPKPTPPTVPAATIKNPLNVAPAPIARLKPHTTVARGPRIADVAPAAPPKPVDTIKAAPPKFIDKPGLIPTALRTVRDTFKDTVQRGVDLTEAIAPTGKFNEDTKQYEAPKVTPLERGSAMWRAALGGVNLAFAPISGVMKGAEEIELKDTASKINPALVTTKAVATGLNKATEFVGEVGGKIAKRGVAALPVSEETKQKLDPIAEETGALLAILLAGKVAHEGSKLPKEIKDFKTRVATTNDIVTSAGRILDVPVEKNVMGQVKRVNPEVVKENYRRSAHEVHPDRGGTAQEFQVVAKARDILNDHATMSAKAFAEKYNAPLTEVQKRIQALPDPEAPKSTFEGLAERLKVEEQRAITPKTVPETITTRPAAPIAPSGVPTVPTPSKPPSFELPKVKGVPIERVSFKAENPIHDRVMTELLGAERGRRIATQNLDNAGMSFTRQASTFPTWIPKELRRKPLLDSVANHVYNGTMPTKAAEARLYKVVAEEMRAQNDVLNDAAFIQEQRQNLYDPFATVEENAAKLAKFDEEYAKLKSGEASIEATSGGSVQGVDQPVVLRDKVFPASEPTPSGTPGPKPSERSMTLPSAKSKVGKSIEAKAIENQLAESFSQTAEYTPTTIKEQAARVAEIMNTDMDRAIRIIRGEEKLPDGVLGGAFIKAMEDYAIKNGDARLALDIANSPLTAETSIYAQELRMLAERDPDSAVAAIQQLKRIKKERAEKMRETKSKVVREIKEKIKSEKKTTTKETWSSFIDSITC